MKERKARTTSGDKTICLPMPADQDYTTFVEDTAGYRADFDQMTEAHPELFPSEISQGYSFHGFVEWSTTATRMTITIPTDSSLATNRSIH